MTKLVVPQILSSYLSTEQLNQVLQDIATALDNTLSRDGTSPNQLEADLDMNGYGLLNADLSTNPTALITRGAVESMIALASSGFVKQTVEIQTATAAQTMFTLTTAIYAVGQNNLAVYVDGIRKFATQDYTETSTSSITFLSGLTGGEKVEFVVNEYLGTADFPVVNLPWSSLYGAPAYATRWPSYAEVTGKPTSFAPAAHTHAPSNITASGASIVDGARGIFVQASTPTATRAGDLWIY